MFCYPALRYSWYIFVFIVCGFGLIAYVSSFMFLKAFTPYLDEVTKKYTTTILLHGCTAMTRHLNQMRIILNPQR